MRLPVPGTGMRTKMTARGGRCVSRGAGLRCCRHGHVVPGQDRPTLRPRPSAGAWFGPVRAVLLLRLRCLSKRPGSLSLGFGLSHALDDKLLRDKHTVNVRAYLSRIAAWHVDKFEFPLHAHGVYNDLPGRSPVMGAAGRRVPQHFHRVRTASGPLCTRHPHVVHTKPVTAQRPPRSVAGRSGRAGTARATARHPVLRGSTPMAWRRLADVAAATQPKRGSDDPKVSDSIRTNGPYLASEGSRSGYQPL